MEASTRTARQLYGALKADPRRRRFGFGRGSRHRRLNVGLRAKYADVLPVAEVVDFLERSEPVT